MITSENTILLSASFILLIIFFYFASGRNLRPKFIIDVYTFLYFILASMFCTFMDIIFNYDIDIIFIVTYLLSFGFFVIAFIISSFFCSKKLSKFLTIDSEIEINNDYFINKLFKEGVFIKFFILFTIISFIIAYDSFQKYLVLDNLHSGNAGYILENYSSRLVAYLSSSLSIANSYFFFYLFACNTKTMQKNIFCGFFILFQLFIFLLSSSRASFIYLLLPVGLIVFYLNIYKFAYYKKITNIKYVLSVLMLPICFSLYRGYSESEDILIGSQEIIMRLMLSSDVNYWFHSIGNLNITFFPDYNLSYYFHPILKFIGLVDSSPGLGIRIAELAGNNDLGKGPIPTFIYEAYILSGSSIYAVIYSGILGLAIPILRFISIKNILTIHLNKLNFFYAFLFYNFTVGLVGDSLLFEISLAVYLFFLLLVLFFFKFSFSLKTV